MFLSPEFMRACLVVCILGMALLAGLYLRRRSLTYEETIRWGLIILLLPVLGPFLAILAKPGKPRPS